MAERIADILGRGVAGLPSSFKVRDHRVGSWHIDDFLNALAILVERGKLDAFDGDAAYDSGTGEVKLWMKGKYVEVKAA